MKKQSLMLILFIILLTSAQAGAATVNWNISVGGPWSTSTNWNPAKVPDSEDDVFINNAGTGTVTVDTTAAAKTLTVGGEKTIKLSTGKLTISAGVPCDTTPDTFTLTDQTGVALSQPITSTTITVNGITCASSISISVGSEYKIGGGDYTGASGTVSNGNTVTVRQTSSASYTTSMNAVLTIGGISDTFSVTTQYAPGVGPQVTTFSDYFGGTQGMAFDSAGNLYVTDTSGPAVHKITPGGVSSVWISTGEYLGNPDRTGTNLPMDIAFDGSDNAYISNDGGNMDSNQYILKAPVADPTAVEIYAGTGSMGRNNDSNPLQATFKRPYGLARFGDILYLADAGNSYIRKIVLSSGDVSDFVSTGAYDVAVDSVGNVYTCSDNIIKKYASTGGAATATYTLPDTPATPFLYSLAVDASGNIYAPDEANHIVWQITSGGVATVFAGTPGVYGLVNGAYSDAKFRYPRGIAIDSTGSIYIGDSDNNRIRKISNDYTSANIGTLKYVPAGSFQRNGTPANISTVTTAFRMSEKEITQAQYFAVTGSAPSSFTGDTLPVERVSWFDAVEFCNDLSTSEGLTPVYTITRIDPVGTGHPILNATVAATWTNNGYRLPTEMEWMWAAMGATSGSGWTSPTYLTGYGKLFAGSNATNAAGDNGTNVIGDYAWTVENNSPNGTKPVGTAGTTGHPNELGLYDMSGNVWEWVWDWYQDDPGGAWDSNTEAGRGAASGTARVFRGGSWDRDASNATVAFRGGFNPGYQDGSFGLFGFRVVRN